MFYPFHPRAGEHIFVVGARSHRDENCYVIALENGKSELIPEWMTKSDAQNMSIISTQKKLIELLAEMVSNYWENNNDQFNPTKKGKRDVD